MSKRNTFRLLNIMPGRHSVCIKPFNHFWAHFTRDTYTIRLKFSNFFIHHYFQNQMFENFTYAFNMSSDAQIHVSKRVCVLFSRSRVATLRLKNHANHVPSISRTSHVINVCLV